MSLAEKCMDWGLWEMIEIGQIRIMGGVDKMVMAQGPGPTRAYLEKLKPWVEKGGFIPFCDHRCPPTVSQADYLAYLDIKEELFGMR